MIVAMAWLFLRHDAFLYTNPVGQVTRVSEKETQKITDEHQNSDFIMTQKITVKLLNHAKKTI